MVQIGRTGETPQQKPVTGENNNVPSNTHNNNNQYEGVCLWDVAKTMEAVSSWESDKFENGGHLKGLDKQGNVILVFENNENGLQSVIENEYDENGKIKTSKVDKNKDGDVDVVIEYNDKEKPKRSVHFGLNGPEFVENYHYDKAGNYVATSVDNNLDNIPDEIYLHEDQH